MIHEKFEKVRILGILRILRIFTSLTLVLRLFAGEKTLPVVFQNDGQRNKKLWAMFEKNTGNVFQNDGQRFAKPWATKNWLK